MQLNELLETYSIKEISKRTNISEENLEALFHKEFDVLTKVKALGFISIVERELKADLSALRKEAKAYYKEHEDDVGVVFDAPVVESKEEGGKALLWFILIAVILGGGWFVSARFDKSKLDELKAMLPTFSKHSSSVTKEALPQIEKVETKGVTISPETTTEYDTPQNF
jgi:predicted secreted protein